MENGRASSVTLPVGTIDAQLCRLPDKVDMLYKSFLTVTGNNDTKLSRLTERVDELSDYIYNIVFRQIDELLSKKDESGRLDAETNRDLRLQLTKRVDEHEEFMQESVCDRLSDIETRLHQTSTEQKTFALSLRHLKTRVDEHAEYMYDIIYKRQSEDETHIDEISKKQKTTATSVNGMRQELVQIHLIIMAILAECIDIWRAWQQSLSLLSETHGFINRVKFRAEDREAVISGQFEKIIQMLAKLKMENHKDFPNKTHVTETGVERDCNMERLTALSPDLTGFVEHNNICSSLSPSLKIPLEFVSPQYPSAHSQRRQSLPTQNLPSAILTVWPSPYTSGAKPIGAFSRNRRPEASPNATISSTYSTPLVLPLSCRQHLQFPYPTTPVQTGVGFRNPIVPAHNLASTRYSPSVPPATYDENTRVRQVMAAELTNEPGWHSSSLNLNNSRNSDKSNDNIIHQASTTPATPLRRHSNSSTRIPETPACIERLIHLGQRCNLRRSVSNNNDLKMGGRDVLVRLIPDHCFLRIEPSHLSSTRLDRIKNAGSAAAGEVKDADADQKWKCKTDMPPTLWNREALGATAGDGDAYKYSLGSARLKWVPTSSKVATGRKHKMNTQSEAAETAVLISARGILALTAPNDYEAIMLERALNGVMTELRRRRVIQKNWGRGQCSKA